MPAMFVVGFFTVGGHSALHSISGIFYPSACRSNGAGWALSVSRLGTIGGPYLGGILLAAHMPLREIFHHRLLALSGVRVGHFLPWPHPPPGPA